MPLACGVVMKGTLSTSSNRRTWGANARAPAPTITSGRLASASHFAAFATLDGSAGTSVKRRL